MFGELILVLALILLNGFFSLSEMAIVSSRKARLRVGADDGRKNYRLALSAAEKPGRYLSAIQVAITLIGILTGAVGGATLSQGLGAWLSGIAPLAPIANSLAVAIIVVLTTLVSVILGELVPKNLALARPEPIAAIEPVEKGVSCARPLNCPIKFSLAPPVMPIVSSTTSACCTSAIRRKPPAAAKPPAAVAPIAP